MPRRFKHYALRRDKTKVTRNAAGAATLKRRTSAATRKSCAVEQIRNGARARENDATLRGIYAQVRENNAELRGINAQRRINDADVRETKKPTVGELFNAAKYTALFS